MGDLILNYRACGAECREDWLRMLAHDNGLPLVAVQQLADELASARILASWCVCASAAGASRHERSRAERIARLLDIARRAATELPRGGP